MADRRTGRLSVTAIAVAAGLVSACAGGSSGWDSGDSPTKALQAADHASMKYPSARTTYTGSESFGGRSIPIQGRAVTNFRDGSALMHASVPSLGEVETRIVGGTMYEKIPDTTPSSAAGMWVSLDLSDRSSGSARSGGVSSGDMLGLMNNSSFASVKRSGSVKVNGRATTKFDAVVDIGRVPQSQLSDVSAGFGSFLKALELGSMPMTAYVDSDGLIRRVTISAKNQQGSIDLTTDFVQYGVPVHVTAPPADQVMPYASMKEVLGQDSGN